MKPRCSKCHRALSDPYSIAVGMGPECRGGARKSGVKFPKPKFKVSGGKMIFVGVEGKVEFPPTIPPTLPSPKRKPLLGEGKERMDEKEALVRRAMKRSGHVFENAVNALHEYMREKDSPVSWAWCNRYVLTVIEKMRKERRP